MGSEKGVLVDDYGNTWQHVNNCPLCGSGSFRYLYTVEADAYQHLTTDVSPDIRLCRSCCLGWCSPRCIDFVALGRPYLDENEEGRMELIRQTAGMTRLMLDWVEKRIDGKGTLLDVGSGLGHFLAQAQKLGWQVVGVEPAPSRADFARRHFGVSVFAGTLEQADFDQTFDMVTLMDVIEHLTEPLQMLREINTRLRKEGYFLIKTPDILSIEARIKRERWWNLPINSHYTFWTMTSLEWALERSGFVVLDRMLWMPGARKTRNLIKRAFALLGITTASMAVLARKARETEVEQQGQHGCEAIPIGTRTPYSGEQAKRM